MNYNITVEDKKGNTLEFMGFDRGSEELLQRAFHDERGINVLNRLSADEALPLVVSAYRQMSYHPGIIEPRSNREEYADYEDLAASLKELCLYLIESLDAVVKVYQ